MTKPDTGTAGHTAVSTHFPQVLLIELLVLERRVCFSTLLGLFFLSCLSSCVTGCQCHVFEPLLADMVTVQHKATDKCCSTPLQVPASVHVLLLICTAGFHGNFNDTIVSVCMTHRNFFSRTEFPPALGCILLTIPTS